MRYVLPVLALLAAPAKAEEVDLELLLLVDVSRSMSASELELQRQGYVEALRSDAVAAALGRALTGRMALAYVEWAGETRRRVIQDWRLIESRDDLLAVADLLETDRTTRQSRTSITAALRFGAGYFDDNGFEGMRRVIDISGDGPNNQGGLVTAARDAVVAQGITVNGLPLMTEDGSFMRIDDLDRYYELCVIGGPGAFVMPVTGWEDFAEAVTRKLVLEIAGAPVERVIPVQAAAAYDCEIGEKMWRRMRMDSDF
ncbi:uncharacterized protein DUF1194 [Defluviimonas denitrificans]|jgi:hypothetical protein|uniref:Uncharacterized protein DUF1194 n=1 Tax=Albidovulum denitrificans TaxID=404881 RepID=A0A2S8SC06_9RHOB|nr:DUF1194 domain-containing protein [Defluviimonas denitrificans]PQV58248.1 uncharacterized protein DUF1194 [Defluviimonas denitrificans]